MHKKFKATQQTKDLTNKKILGLAVQLQQIFTLMQHEEYFRKERIKIFKKVEAEAVKLGIVEP